jgi:hypothetical protein
VEVSRQGTIRVSAAAGIGYTPCIEQIESLTRRREILE